MTTLTTKSRALAATTLTLAAGGLVAGAVPAHAAVPSTPKLAAAGYVANGQAQVNIYSARGFHSKESVKSIANAYRPKNMTLHLGSRSVKLKFLNEAMPEFIYVFTGSGRGVKVGAKGTVTFSCKKGRFSLPVKFSSQG